MIQALRCQPGLCGRTASVQKPSRLPAIFRRSPKGTGEQRIHAINTAHPCTVLIEIQGKMWTWKIDFFRKFPKKVRLRLKPAGRQAVAEGAEETWKCVARIFQTLAGYQKLLSRNGLHRLVPLESVWLRVLLLERWDG